VTNNFIGIILLGVIANDQGPARVGTGVGIAAVQQITMEEQAVAGIHFKIDKWQPLKNFFHSGRINPRLPTDFSMFQATQMMTAGNYL
jgi:hypothetical protein